MHIGKQTDGHTNREQEHMDIQTYREMNRLNRQRQMDGWVDGQTDR